MKASPLSRQPIIICGPPPAGSNTGNLIIKNDYSANNYDDLALLRTSDYQERFGKRRYKDNRKRKILAVVKITNPETRMSIYRAYRGDRAICNGQVGLTSNSLRLLSDDSGASSMPTLEITKGCELLYFWKHPFHATRISMKLGTWGIIAGAIRTIISCFVSCS